MIWFSSGVPSARKEIITFIDSKRDALRSMRQGSCIMHASYCVLFAIPWQGGSNVKAEKEILRSDYSVLVNMMLFVSNMPIDILNDRLRVFDFGDCGEGEIHTHPREISRRHDAEGAPKINFRRCLLKISRACVWVFPPPHIRHGQN